MTRQREETAAFRFHVYVRSKSGLPYSVLDETKTPKTIANVADRRHADALCAYLRERYAVGEDEP